MNKANNKVLLVYDGNCRVCIGLKNLLIQIKVVDVYECIAYQDTENDVKQRIEIDEFRNGVALFWGDSELPMYGSASIALLFERAFPFFKNVFKLKFIFAIFTFIYKMIAYNRYVIFLPKRPAIDCDCYPAHAVYFRIGYILFTWAMAFMLFYLAFNGMECLYESLLMPLREVSTGIVFLPFILQLIVFGIVSKEQLYEYAGHTASILLTGGLIMIPSLIVSFLMNGCSGYTVFFNFLISAFYMMRMHTLRSDFMLIKKAWKVSLPLLFFISILCGLFVCL